jgi:hypothetical protein
VPIFQELKKRAVQFKPKQTIEDRFFGKEDDTASDFERIDLDGVEGHGALELSKSKDRL